MSIMTTFKAVVVGMCSLLAVASLGACGSTASSGGSNSGTTVAQLGLQMQADICDLVTQGYSPDGIVTALQADGVNMSAALEVAVINAAGRC